MSNTSDRRKFTLSQEAQDRLTYAMILRKKSRISEVLEEVVLEALPPVPMPEVDELGRSQPYVMLEVPEDD